MEKKFDKMICNGVIYDREDVLKVVRAWIKSNLILNYGVIRVPNETVQNDLFELFNIMPHYPMEYRDKGLDGTDFFVNILLDAGMQSGRQEKQIEMYNALRQKDEEYLKLLEEKQNKIKELEAKLSKQEKVSIKK